MSIARVRAGIQKHYNKKCAELGNAIAARTRIEQRIDDLQIEIDNLDHAFGLIDTFSKQDEDNGTGTTDPNSPGA